MDKFGIFDILTALAPILQSARQTPPPDKTDTQTKTTQPFSETQSPFSTDVRTASAQSLLERHSAISQRIDRNKK